MDRAEPSFDYPTVGAQEGWEPRYGVLCKCKVRSAAMISLQLPLHALAVRDRPLSSSSPISCC
jgi:hypothetical protein